MFYTKPKDITYTGMAIFIDNHPIFNLYDELLENKIFEYIYHLAYMLARLHRYFYKSIDYDNFSLYVASIVLMRLKKEPIKSVLNYLKAILYFKKVEYLNDNFSLILSKESENTIISEYTFSSRLLDSSRLMDNTEFLYDLENIHKSIKFYLKRIPYKENSVIWNNIYISCLLTFLDHITLSNNDCAKLQTKRTPLYLSKLNDILLDKESKNTKAILYHLDDSMNDYIIVLVRLIKQFLADNLSYICHTSINYSDVSNLVITDINSYEYGDLYE